MSNPNPNEPTRFQKGKSGNPGGRSIITPLLRARLAEVDQNDRYKRTHGEIIVAKMVMMAKKGSNKAIAEILDRIEGKAIQPKIDLSPKGTREERLAKMMEAMQIMEGWDGDADAGTIQ